MGQQDFTIRPITADDRDKLAQVRADYLISLHSVIMTEERQAYVKDLAINNRVQAVLEDPFINVLLLEENGSPKGYIAYGPDREDPGCGYIYEAALLPENDQHRHELLARVMEELFSKGLQTVRIWIIRSNLRGRFFLEQHGFRNEGLHRTVNLNDSEVSLTRYVFTSRATSGV